MYKKIKNSSFMNLIWFIICIFPILLIFIYGLSLQASSDTSSEYNIELESIKGSTKHIIYNHINDTNSLVFESGYKSDNCEFVPVNNLLEFGVYIKSPNNQIDNSDKYFTFLKDINDTWTSQNINEMFFRVSYDNSSYVDINVKTNFFAQIVQTSRTIVNFKPIDIAEYYLNAQNISYDTITDITFKLKSSQNTKFIILLTDYNLYNYNWFENYSTYVNDYNNIYFNSTPISYTYNDIEYQLNTTNNNYLGSGQLLNVNTILPFYDTPNQLTINYNNYNGMEQLGTIEELNLIQQYDSNYTYYYYYSNTTIGTYALKECGNTQIQNLQNNFDTYKSQYYMFKYSEPIQSIYNFSAPYVINNYSNFLENVLISVQSNGFISNTFLNLSTYFGVNNVYYSLACYYIEYLLVIILLHLGFDLLYIVPNICHKFMEKIGGERD